MYGRFSSQLTLLLLLATKCAEAVFNEVPVKSEFESPDDTPNAQPFLFNPTGGIWETAAKAVAKLVSSNFPVPPPRQAGSDFISNILRILGLDQSKLGAIALNALIFLAHVIGSTIKGKTPLKPSEEDDIGPQGNPLTWTFIDFPNEARELVRAAQEKSLPERLIKLLRDGATGETDCVQLLLCRSSPIIWAMQKSLYKPPDPSWPRLMPLERMFAYFPTLEEILQHAATCNVRFPSCNHRHSHLNYD
ncbi:uncharacterized protein LOC106670156 [Cimex lectularius]|uniref:Uncharacterized protein n=1 Tax=Cimex lectularius TaxID=79782 RepID=A0A8I6TK67_CIMLE|nr:uncharacterized protein LOC106670156 [Cimex lectularius]